MGKLAKTLTAFIAIGPLLLLGTPPVVAASPSPKTCNVNFKGHDLKAPPGGGASVEDYTVGNDCSVIAGPVRTLTKGSPEFLAFRTTHGSRKSGSIDPGCNSELDYVDVKGYILTFTWFSMNYGYNPGAGQVTSVGPYYRSAGAAIDGWYVISTHLSPWTGPIPYGTVTSSYNGTFAWVFGSFWHSGTNNNRADGFGQCDGWPNESGSTVPGGRWVWGTWQT